MKIFMYRFGPLIGVCSLICMFLLWIPYAMKHGYFATSRGGSHVYIVYSKVENMINKCDSLQRIYAPNINQNDFNIDSLISKKSVVDYWRFPIRVDNKYVYVQIQTIGSSQKDRTDLLLLCFSNDRNFNNAITFGEANKKEREQVLKAFENQILSQLGVSYEESWAQYY